MKVELMLSPFDATIGGLRRAAAIADEAGVTGLWTMDHLTGTVHAERETVLECLLSLSVMAEATRSCRIGSLVLNPVSRQPVVLAQALAGLQELAGGRLVVGVGAGGGGGDYAAELESAGLTDHSAAVRRMRVEELVTILQHIWTGSTGKWVGELYELAGSDGFHVPAVRPPVVIGGYGRRMAELAGRCGEGFNTVATHPDVAHLVGLARDTHEATGRAGPFETSVFALYEPEWLDPTSPGRRELDEAGVETLIIVVDAPHDEDLIVRIAEA